MPRLFELADSEISRIDTTPDGLVIHFAAALLSVDDAQAAPASAPSCGTRFRGYSNGLSLQLHNATVTGDPAGCVGRLVDGTVVAAGERLSALPVPSGYQAAAGGVQLQLHLHCANGAWLQAKADALRCTEADGAQWVEVFQC